MKGKKDDIVAFKAQFSRINVWIHKATHLRENQRLCLQYFQLCVLSKLLIYLLCSIRVEPLLWSALGYNTLTLLSHCCGLLSQTLWMSVPRVSMAVLPGFSSHSSSTCSTVSLVGFAAMARPARNMLPRSWLTKLFLMAWLITLAHPPVPQWGRASYKYSLRKKVRIT